MRPLTTAEVEKLSYLTELEIPVGLLQPTTTALKKGIIDAVAPFREYLLLQGLHDYSRQPKGQDNKKLIPTRLLGSDLRFHDALTSLYRPQTKDGDPRAWVYGLAKHAEPDDILVFFNRDEYLYVLNLTRHDLRAVTSINAELRDAVEVLGGGKSSTVDELLSALRDVAARGFLDAGAGFDTTVGMLLERELGIAPNSRREPDYKGIEIKSARGGARGNRHNLFAKVPNWARSPVASSRRLLDEFGYIREGRLQLYCTVNAKAANPQGLRLEVDEDNRDLWERSNRPDLSHVVVWPMSGLESALASKHAETFWVEAQSKRTGGVEQLRFVRVQHTAGPIIQQFGPLVSSGHITLDHLVRDRNGVAAERGPLFKLSHGSLGLLFPPARTYELLG